MKRRKLPGCEYLPFVAWCSMGVAAGVINQNYIAASLVVVCMVTLLCITKKWISA